MRVLLALGAIATLSCAQQSDARSAQAAIDRPAASTRSAPAARPGRQAVEVEMSNVDLRVTADVTLQIKHLRGRFVPEGRAQAPYLDDKHSYSVAIDSGEILLDMASLNALMKRTLERGDANVENVRISTDEERGLRQKGVLDKGIKLPFDVRGQVDTTADGRIRLHASSVKGLGIPMKSLMRAFGIHMDDIVTIKAGHGVTVKDDDLILDPEQLMPAPTIRGKITSVRVTDGALVQTFGSGERRQLSPPAVSRNYIYWRGGELQFGKLTMVETDLELIDDDPRDPFDFSVDHWNDQLIAGYSKNTKDGGLKTHVPDYNDLEKRSSGHR
jgi:hypothetical protein